MVNYGDAIHAALMEVVQDFKFLAIDYPTARRRVTSTEIAKPSTIKIDQRSAAFVQAIQNRQSRFNQRAAWTWVVDVHFNRAVSLEEFEDFVAQNPPRIPRDASDGRPQQVDIFLEEAEDYVHPPRKSPSTGTRARYRFVAELSPL